MKTYMTNIDPNIFADAAKELGMSKWKLAQILLPHLYEADAYRTIKRWHDLGRMPTAKRNELYGYLRKESTDIHQE